MNDIPTPRTDSQATRILAEFGPANSQRFAAMADHARTLERELALASAKVQEGEADRERLTTAGELLLFGYEGLGGDMENTGPRAMRWAIDHARSAARTQEATQ